MPKIRGLIFVAILALRNLINHCLNEILKSNLKKKESRAFKFSWLVQGYEVLYDRKFLAFDQQ